jgi:hypothetical protein
VHLSTVVYLTRATVGVLSKAEMDIIHYSLLLISLLYVGAGVGIHSSGGSNSLSFNSNNPNSFSQIPLASGSDYPPCPARLFDKSSPNGTMRWS